MPATNSGVTTDKMPVRRHAHRARQMFPTCPETTLARTGSGIRSWRRPSALAAIERPVHYCVIRELTIPSYRMGQAKPTAQGHAGIVAADLRVGRYGDSVTLRGSAKPFRNKVLHGRRW